MLGKYQTGNYHSKKAAIGNPKDSEMNTREFVPDDIILLSDDDDDEGANTYETPVSRRQEGQNSAVDYQPSDQTAHSYLEIAPSMIGINMEEYETGNMGDELEKADADDVNIITEDCIRKKQSKINDKSTDVQLQKTKPAIPDFQADVAEANHKEDQNFCSYLVAPILGKLHGKAKARAKHNILEVLLHNLIKGSENAGVSQKLPADNIGVLSSPQRVISAEDEEFCTRTILPAFRLFQHENKSTARIQIMGALHKAQFQGEVGFLPGE